MPKSKNRKGHKQKVAQRNVKLENLKKTYQKLYNEVLMNQIEMLKEKFKSTGDTESDTTEQENN